MANDAFYTQLVQEITPLIEEYGTTYQARGREEYDPVAMESKATAQRSIRGVKGNSFEASELGSDVGGRNKGGSNVLGHDTLYVLPDAQLTMQDEVEVDGVWYSCERLEAIKPGNVTVLYVVTLVN